MQRRARQVTIQNTMQYETAPDINITEGVRKLLTGLNPHKAAGPDSITPRVLKELVDEIAP